MPHNNRLVMSPCKWSTYVEIFRTLSSIIVFGLLHFNCIFDQDLIRIFFAHATQSDKRRRKRGNEKEKRDHNQPPPAKISIIQSTNTQQRYPFLSRSKMSAKRKTNAGTHTRAHTQIKVNKIRCHIKMLWHFASDLCVCVEHIDYGNKNEANRWIKCRQRYAPTINTQSEREREWAHTCTHKLHMKWFLADGSAKWLQMPVTKWKIKTSTITKHRIKIYDTRFMREEASMSTPTESTSIKTQELMK